MRKELLLFLLFFYFCSFSQREDIDSIRSLLKTVKEEKRRASLYADLGSKYTTSANYDSALHFNKISYDLARKIDFKKGMSRALGNLGVIYKNKNDLSKGLEYAFQALDISEAVNDDTLTASHLGNIGIIYEEIGDYLKAYGCYQKVLKINEQVKNEEAIGYQYANMGVIKKKLGDVQSALDNYFKALKIFEKRKDKYSSAIAYGNVGMVYCTMKDYPSAIKFCEKSMCMSEEIGDQVGIAISMGNLGTIYLLQKKYKEAEEMLQKALVFSEKIEDIVGVMDDAKSLAELYEITGNYKRSLEFHKKYLAAKDSLHNADQNKALTKLELTHAYDKKELEKKAEQDKKDSIAKAKSEKQKLIIILICVGLALALILAIIIFRSLRITRKQKAIIELKNAETEEQKRTIEEKNKEITDSINYAQRIQKGILPSDIELQNVAGEHFVLFKPKDIVSGDFYWCAKTKDISLVAAADSTGHGVPGAFMSMLGKTLLTQAVKDPSIQMPSQVLNYVNAELPNNLKAHSKETSIKDGMDIVLCAIDRKKNVLHFAGANNPLWIVRDKTLMEFTANKQAITASNEFEKKPFGDQLIDLQKGDCVYLFTDGYADQFGGPKGKKFKYRQLSDRLTEFSSLPLNEQKEKLDQVFENWKGDLEQVDDVCIIGIRI